MMTVFDQVKCSTMLSGDSSRPSPLSLMPPYRRRFGHRELVDLHEARFDPSMNCMARGEVAGPQHGRKTVARVVGFGEHASKSVHGVTVATGPKISSRHTGEDDGTPSISVGV